MGTAGAALPPEVVPVGGEGSEAPESSARWRRAPIALITAEPTGPSRSENALIVARQRRVPYGSLGATAPEH